MIYSLEKSKNPFFILPGSIFELDSLVQDLQRGVGNRTDLRERIRDRILKLTNEKVSLKSARDLRKHFSLQEIELLSAIAIPSNTPLRRVRRLIQEERLVMHLDIESNLDEKGLTEELYGLFVNKLPSIFQNPGRILRIRRSIYRDAYNLALIAKYNSEKPSEPFTHFTGTKRLLHLSDQVHEVAMRYFGKDVYPLIVDPHSWAMKAFFSRYDNPILERLAELANHLHTFPRFREAILQFLDHPEQTHPIPIIEMIQSFKGSITDFGKQLDPFHIDILNTEIEDMMFDIKVSCYARQRGTLEIGSISKILKTAISVSFSRTSILSRFKGVSVVLRNMT